MEKEKKKIMIEVEPMTAVIAMGIMKGYMPSVLQQMSERMLEMPKSINFSEGFEERIMEVINEIYEKCIAETQIRQGAASLMEILDLTGQYPDNVEN